MIKVKHGTCLHTSLAPGDDPNVFPLDAPKYTEDGIVHYMRALREHYDVIGLAISAENSVNVDDLKVTCFRALEQAPVERIVLKGMPSPAKCRAIIEGGRQADDLTEGGLKKFAGELHDFLRDEMELSKDEKPLLVSAIMLALRSDFRKTYYSYSDLEELADNATAAIKAYLNRVRLPAQKAASMTESYRLIQTKMAVRRNLSRAIAMVDRKLGGYARNGNMSRDSFDIIGHFYREFLRYTGGDKQSLGIVLTPQHVCELYAEVSELNPESSVVLDTCTGTVGFPVAAMANIMLKAGDDEDLQNRIKSKGLVGIEKKAEMFTLACANMILRGDGKANMFQGDCITDEDIFAKVRMLRPNVAIINPPYAKAKEDQHEFGFIRRPLDMLEPSGMCIAIVPMRLAIATDASHEGWKRRILEARTLEAVMSMPDDLFPGVGVVTCTMVFQAKQPHARSRRDTWFAQWKDDGFRPLKGDRVERTSGFWATTREIWLDMYRNRRVVEGKSATAKVGVGDKWCAEAYLEPDFSVLTRDSFAAARRDYALHKLFVETARATR